MAPKAPAWRRIGSSLFIAIVTALAAGGVAWGALGSTVEAHGEAITTLQAQQAVQTEYRGYVKGKLEGMGATMQRIERKLDKSEPE